VNYWDPFETRGHGKFPEGTPQEMKQLSLEPGPDLFGASGFMGQIPSKYKDEDGGSFKIDMTKDAQSKFVMVPEEPEEPTLDISPAFPQMFAPQEVGEEPKDVITPITDEPVDEDEEGIIIPEGGLQQHFTPGGVSVDIGMQPAPALESAAETNWGLIALAGLAALYILKS
jgi:hypothetical protein